MRELKVGDVIQVRSYELIGIVAHERWKPALIISMDHTILIVRFLDKSDKEMGVLRSEYGHHWK